MTKKKIAWITDSTAYISKELLEHPDVYIVPLSITFGEESFEDGIDLNTDQLYSRIRTEKEVPKTSQPSAGRFAELFETLKIEYDAAVAVHVSSKLSGTMNSCLAGSELAGFHVSAVDSKCMSYAITSLIYKGLKLAENDVPAQKIAEILQSEADKSENYILLGSLEQFYKGGRMSGTQYLLGSILKIKPIIRINRNGEFELFDKVRSDKKAIKRMVELLGDAYENHTIPQVQIMHGNVRGKAEELAEEIQSYFSRLDIIIGEISSTIAAHAGEGTIAIIWQNEK
ncbi:DegV family protein with EDD domain [Cytobacillus firmus]|uniref:DegV family protein with EDD domain n=2 Tax=Cytobacillus TaxID=2675230 RepID=A0A366K4P0_CYTFI|nr:MULTISPECIES: DegV family protein [Cytobacillus]RBP96227.1 DegV family protein with EDD domain [Cytobacillus firmus]TDX46048.1 DegV family protein with EDD domain [Cytobacillus oceanisediminis]